MQTTFILKNLTEETLSNIADMPPHAAYDKLCMWAFGDLKHCVSVKYGPSNAFRDRVEWNSIMREVKNGTRAITLKIEPRRGYKLATFGA